MADETPNWFDGLDAAEKGVLQTQGWDKLPVNEAATAVLREYRKAQAVIGMPASEVLRVPKDPNDAGWAEVHKRLGVPEDKALYKFDEIKFSDGTAVDDKFAGLMRDTASGAKLTPAQAASVTAAVVKYLDEVDKEATTSATFKASAEMETLKNNWGANFETNTFIARKAAEALGVTNDAFDAMVKNFGLGAAQTMETMRKLGVAMGEARFITGANPQNNGVMSLDQAVARKAELMNDRQWSQKFLAGDPTAAREMSELNTLIVRGGQRAA